MKKFLTSVIMVVAAMSMVVTSADAKSRSSSRSSFSSSKSSSYSFKSSSSYKPSSSSYSSSSYKPSTSYNKPSTTVSPSASSYTVKPVVPVATKPTVTSPASYAPSTPAVVPTSKVSTAVKAAGVGAVATAGAVATHNALASDHHDSAATMANVASSTSTSTIPVPSAEQHVADNSNVTSDSTTTVPASSVKTDKPVTISLDKKDTAATPAVKPAVSVVDTQVKPAVKNVQNVNVVNKNVNRPQNRTAQNMMTYYALRNMHRPTRGYHTYSSNNYSNKALLSSDWERAANATGVYTNHFDSVNTFEEKSVKECTGEVYLCDNTNSDDFVYDVALYQGFVDAMGSRANSYGLPDLQNRVYAKFQSDYQSNKYRLEKISSKMKGDDVTVSIVKQAYFTGYAAGLYTIKNRL